MRTPARNEQEEDEDLMELDNIPSTQERNNREQAPPPAPGSATRSVSSRSSAATTLTRAAANNASKRGRVNIRGDQGSMASGVAPFSPASSLGLESLSPVSKTNMNSPRRASRAGGGIYLLSTQRSLIYIIILISVILASDILNSPLNYGTPTSVSTPRTSAVATATPLRQRNDINADRNIRQINMQAVS
jgi:hypothetical protein